MNFTLKIIHMKILRFRTFYLSLTANCLSFGLRIQTHVILYMCHVYVGIRDFIVVKKISKIKKLASFRVLWLFLVRFRRKRQKTKIFQEMMFLIKMELIRLRIVHTP